MEITLNFGNYLASKEDPRPGHGGIFVRIQTSLEGLFFVSNGTHVRVGCINCGYPSLNVVGGVAGENDVLSCGLCGWIALDPLEYHYWGMKHDQKCQILYSYWLTRLLGDPIQGALAGHILEQRISDFSINQYRRMLISYSSGSNEYSKSDLEKYLAPWTNVSLLEI